MTSVTWLLLALALCLLGPVPQRREGGEAAPRRELPTRTLQVVAAGAVVLLAVLALGPVTGTMCAAVAAPAGYAVVGRLHARPARARTDPDLALCLDLAAVALRAGQPLPAALVLAAPSAGASAQPLVRVAGLLRLGAAPHQAWATLADHPVLGPVAAAGRRSAESGIRLAAAFEQRAVELRADLAATAQARAHRIEVLVAAPLGLCFLPAFVCLGIVPTVIGVAGGVLG